MQQSPEVPVRAIAPHPIQSPRHEERVDGDGQDDEKDREQNCDKRNDDCAAHATPPRKNTGGRPMSAVARTLRIAVWRRQRGIPYADIDRSLIQILSATRILFVTRSLLLEKLELVKT